MFGRRIGSRPQFQLLARRKTEEMKIVRSNEVYIGPGRFLSRDFGALGRGVKSVLRSF